MATLAQRLSDLVQRVGLELKTRGLPSGGTSGQVLRKNSGSNYDVVWGSVAAGAGGSDRQLQFNNGGALDGSSQASIDTDGEIILEADSLVPAAPTTGKAKLYGATLAGRAMLGVRGPSGLYTLLQPHLGRNSVSLWLPAGNGTVITAMGASALTITGTATAENVSSGGNLYTHSKRVSARAAAATNAVAGWRSTAAQNSRRAGLHYVWRFGFAQGVANAAHRSFCGYLPATTAPTDVNPSTLTGVLGVGCDSADTTLHIMHRNPFTATTKINLGAAFPKPSVAQTDIYELAMFCPPNGASISWSFANLVTGAFTEGEITTNLPDLDTLFAPRMYHSAGGVSSVVGITLISGYIETD